MASSDEQREPLLRKDVKYYDNFLGYEVEERKEKQYLTTLDLHSNHLIGPIASVFTINRRFPDGNL
jgi:hypothetical protein